MVIGVVLVSGNGGRYVGPEVLIANGSRFGNKFGLKDLNTSLGKLGVDGRGRNVETGILGSPLPY